MKRRRFLTLAGASTTVLAGCLPAECRPRVSVTISEETTIEETAGWTVDGDLDVDWAETGGTLSSVFVVAYDGAGSELGRASLGDLDDDDGESYDGVPCSGTRRSEPFELTVETLPRELRITGGVREQSCTAGGPEVRLTGFEADPDVERPTDFPDDWTGVDDDCRRDGTTESPGSSTADTSSGTSDDATNERETGTETLSTDTAETPATPANGTVETPTRSDDG